jgi:clan AA aspartic protease
MIAGSVNEYRVPTVDLEVQGPTGNRERFEFIVDTGYDGLLSLHSAIAAELKLQKFATGRAVLADGSESDFETYQGFVVWDGELRPLVIDVVDSVPLLGMGLLEGHELRLQAIADGALQITPLDHA